jgi:sec-independent protein translocase protein TatA
MIPGIGSMGGAELLIPLVIILLFFGAKRLPELGRSLGIGMKELRKEAAGSSDMDEPEQRAGNKDAKEIASSAGRRERID